MSTRFEGPRQAVALLVQALDRADGADGLAVESVVERAIYSAAVAVMLRLVAIECAGHHAARLHAAAPRVGYGSVGGIWERVVAACAAAYAATGLSLFDPARFPVLRDRGRTEPLVDDVTARRLLDAAVAYAAQSVVEALTDGSALGALYEALCAYTATRASEPVVGLRATGRCTVEIPLQTLEAVHARGVDALVAHIAAITGRTPGALRRALAASHAGASERLSTACGDDDLYRRALPFLPLLACDATGCPSVIATGQIYVTPGNARRTAGIHYTPSAVAAEIVETTLAPLVYDGASMTRREEPAARLLALKICDPAMGAGAFLVAAGRYLADRLVEAWADDEQPERPGTLPIPRDPPARLALARRLVAARCLYGVDLDPLAVDLARLVLACFVAVPGQSPLQLERTLRCGDALLGLAPGDEHAAGSGAITDADAWRRADEVVAARLAGVRSRGNESPTCGTTAMLPATYQPFHWRLAFPDVFQPAPGSTAGFDAIIGNPPFGNAVERATARDPAVNRLAARDYDPFARGASDYCLLFWARALLHLLSPHGRYGLLGPTALLSDLKPWQAWVHAHARPTALIAYPSDCFPTARIRVTGYCGGRGAASHVHVVDHCTERPYDAVVPWAGFTGCWHEAVAPVGPAIRDTCRLSDLPLTLHAGCTTEVAYDLAPLVVHGEQSEGLRLVTTGAIGRYACAWGRRPIRYLKHDYHRPRWPDDGGVPTGVARARERQRGPKILLGGLNAVLEAVYDPAGALGGVVSTWVIRLHAAATCDAAYTLLAILNSATFSRLYTQRYGGKAMSGRQMTIQKAALLQMPCPHELAAALRAPYAYVDVQPRLGNARELVAACWATASLLQQVAPSDPCWSQLDKTAHLAAGLLYRRDIDGALDDYQWWCERARVPADPAPIAVLETLLTRLGPVCSSSRSGTGPAR